MQTIHSSKYTGYLLNKWNIDEQQPICAKKSFELW